MCTNLLPTLSDLLVKKAGDGRRSRLETDSSCDDDASAQLSDGPFSLVVYSEEERSGRRKERDGRERIRSHHRMRLCVCGCCVPDSGTAVAPSLLQNHWEIFTDRRGGKKVLHLGVREGGRKGGRV